MKRRALLLSALGLQLGIGGGRASSGVSAADPIADEGVLLSGLAGLDYVTGGISPGDVVCVTSPPHSGKTALLLDWSARICSRYSSNVVFYSANEPRVQLARKRIAKGRTRVFFADEPNPIPFEREIGFSGAIIMLDAYSADLQQAQTLASWLRVHHLAGCAALVSDGWCTTKLQPVVNEFAAEQWEPTLISVDAISDAAEFGRTTDLQVIVGLQTASLVDEESLAESSHLTSQLRSKASCWVSMYRPELYVDTDERLAADHNVACLAGLRPRKPDTRYARLRFDRSLAAFQTVG
jgi:hypothetical protein